MRQVEPLDWSVIVDIRSNRIRAYSADELATYVCEKWYIDDAQSIRQVYQAIREYQPQLV